MRVRSVLAVSSMAPSNGPAMVAVPPNMTASGTQSMLGTALAVV